MVYFYVRDPDVDRIRSISLTENICNVGGCYPFRAMDCRVDYAQVQGLGFSYKCLLNMFFFRKFDKQNLLNIMTIDIEWYLLVVFDSIQIMS